MSILAIMAERPAINYKMTNGDGVADILQRWLGLSALQRRALEALMGEIKLTSDDMGSHVHGLTALFRDIAQTSRTQTATVQDLVGSIQNVSVDGEIISLAEVATSLGDTLTQLIEKIVLLSSRGASMAAEVKAVLKELKSIETSIAAIDILNMQASILALNAKIEAARAGDAGIGFAVVADEVRGLAKAVDNLSTVIRKQVDSLTSGLRRSQGLLHEIATVERSQENLDANARIKLVMRCLVEQNSRYATVLKETAATSEKIANDVSAAIVNMQFEDLAKQRLCNVNGALGALAAALEDLREQSPGGAAADAGADAAGHEWVGRMIAQCTLSETRKRLSERVLGGQAATAAQPGSSAAASDDGIEFF